MDSGVSKYLEVFGVGSNVLIGNCKIDARVTSVCIKNNNHVSYQCCYWNGNTFEENWLEDFEVSPCDESMTKTIGFLT